MNVRYVRFNCVCIEKKILDRPNQAKFRGLYRKITVDWKNDT